MECRSLMYVFLVLLLDIKVANTARTRANLRKKKRFAADFPAGGGGYGNIFGDDLNPITRPVAPLGGKKCMGVNNNKPPDGVCAPCEDPSDENCKQQFDACSDGLCQLCLHHILDCELTVSKDEDGFFENVNVYGSRYAKAVCTAILAKQCSDPKALDCCKANDHTLYDWVATQTVEDNGLTRLLPVPQCVHDTADAELSEMMCETCKARIKLNFKSTPKRCDDFGHPGAGVYKTNLLPKWRKDAPPLLPKWLEKKPPKEKTMREKCDQMNAMLDRKDATFLGSSELADPGRLCECLGCCVGTFAPEPATGRICFDMDMFFADWK